MKKILLILCFAFITQHITAQKANVKSKEITIDIKQPEFLKNAETYSYTIQDDGVYWNYEATDQYPTLASATDGLEIAGLKRVNENADIQVIVGFSGNQLKHGEGTLVLNGSYYLLVLNKNNKLLLKIEEDGQNTVYVNPEIYDTSNRAARNRTKALIVTERVNRILKPYMHLFSGKATVKIPFATFKKTKGGAAETFNSESEPLINAILNDIKDTDAINKAVTYWKTQLDVDFGKKVKDKVKNKVIYANLTSASLLKKDIETAKINIDLLKKYSGFFDFWTTEHKSFMELLESENTIANPEKLKPIIVTPNSTYIITIPEGKYTYKDKDPIAYSKLEIQNFVPKLNSGMASLNTKIKPEIYIYKEEDENASLRHFGSDHNKIVTNDGIEMRFKVYKGEYKLCVKQEDGTYKMYDKDIIIE